MHSFLKNTSKVKQKFKFKIKVTSSSKVKIIIRFLLPLFSRSSYMVKKVVPFFDISDRKNFFYHLD